jgi:hypothetical protein
VVSNLPKGKDVRVLQKRSSCYTQTRDKRRMKSLCKSQRKRTLGSSAAPKRKMMSRYVCVYDGTVAGVLDKSRGVHLCSEPRVLSAVHLAVAVSFVGAHVPLHVGDVVVFGNVPVLLHVWAAVLRHCRQEVIDDFIRDERVS